jgi:hypothetical protein
MEKNIKDYLPFYLGCDVMTNEGKGKLIAVFSDDSQNTSELISLDDGDPDNIMDFQLLPRPLSDMTEEEIIELFLLTFPDDFEDTPTAEECNAEMFYNDGGNMVDADVSVGANIDCRCYEGQIAIRKCGSINFYNANGNLDYFYNAPKAYLLLLSKHFDLFGLIEAGLAIDATTVNSKTTN